MTTRTGWWIGALLVAGCATEPPAELAAASSAREAAADGGEAPVTIDNGDGTFSYPLAADFDVDERLDEGVVVWRYERQARFPWRREPWGEQQAVRRETGHDDPIDTLARTRRVDAAGRVWVVEEVRADELAADLAMADTELASERPASAEAPDDGYAPVEDGEAEPEIAPGTPLRWVPFTWSEPCGLDDRVWDAESRTEVTSPLNDRQKASVALYQRDAGSDFDLSCSGAIVGETFVVTAAHCVSTLVPFGADTEILPGDLRVCTRSNFYSGADCELVEAVTLHPDFNRVGPGGTDYNDDVAILELAQPISPSDFHEMVFASDASVVGFTMHSIGYPGFNPEDTSSFGDQCESNWSSANVVSLVDEASGMWFQTGIDVTDFAGDDAHWTGDHTPGESGSPVFHCTGGTCQSGELARIDAVFAGWNPVTNRFAGPRSLHFSGWATGLITD